MHRYHFALRTDIFSQLFSNRHYILLWLKLTHFFLISNIIFLKTASAQRYLVEQIEESLEILFLFSVSV